MSLVKIFAFIVKIMSGERGQGVSSLGDEKRPIRNKVNGHTVSHWSTVQTESKGQSNVNKSR